ncbi:penicillin-binding protein 2B [Bacillus mesophilus]|uniref:serine-type D-Ala-D-Ala carboxypeptidase n=1 Tax=Bacillus mesophilus TaxID=1808955 RepID=A0A6M0Q1V7_9BACI|nr:penicillin-binding protein [Bacillus mesophilus]MBM7659462.1 penicillin-binding protein 2B [Bacillus mesophilus]NEY70335.1 penicillin-binding protein [Bacillus mesophilus]
MKTKSNNINKGAAIFSVIFGSLFFLIALRFLYIQITGTVDGHELPVMAEEKYTQSTILEADRGSILDRNGIAIAQDTPAYTVVAILDERHSKDSKVIRHVTDVKETAEQLAPLINMTEESLLSLLERGVERDSYQVELGPGGRGISYQLMQKIQALELPGIIFEKEKKRYYPNGNFATHVIGFAKKNDQDVVVGKQGLERTLEDYLKEEDGMRVYKRDRNGITLPTKDDVVPPKNGYNVYLTIDQKIQTFLDDSMNRVMKEYEPENIIGIVADPKTGAVLAMSSRPSYDPNDIPANAYMLNDAIASRFEPGSTMKMFTLAAAIEEGVFDPNEKYKSGSFTVGPSTIRDHFRGGWGTISYLEGFQRSSNVAMANLVMNKMNGDDRLLNYLTSFGFSEPTGIDLPGEVSGQILYNYPIEKVTTSFGQGTTVTPIQQIQAATAIANGGKMMQPYIIDKIVESTTNKVIEDREPIEVGTPISEQTANQVLDILETVVSSENGTGKPYRIEGYQIAGKTGTAQIPDPNAENTKSKYLTGHGNNVFSFLGMAPKEDPKLLVYIAVSKPKLTIHESGSQPVSAIFNSVVKNSLQYLKIQPTLDEKAEKSKSDDQKVGLELPSYQHKDVKSVVDDLTNKQLQAVVIGDGANILSQAPYATSEVIPGEKILLKTDGAYTMPDLTGWSLRDVMKLSSLFNLKVNLLGSGYVINQNIPVNAEIKEGDQLIIELTPPNAQQKPSSTQSEEETDEPQD